MDRLQRQTRERRTEDEDGRGTEDLPPDPSWTGGTRDSGSRADPAAGPVTSSSKPPRPRELLGAFSRQGLPLTPHPPMACCVSDGNRQDRLTPVGRHPRWGRGSARLKASTSLLLPRVLTRALNGWMGLGGDACRHCSRPCSSVIHPAGSDHI